MSLANIYTFDATLSGRSYTIDIQLKEDRSKNTFLWHATGVNIPLRYSVIDTEPLMSHNKEWLNPA